MKAALAALLAAATLANAQTATTSEPAYTEIEAAAVTTQPEVTTSNVKGVAFDRFYQVWLENTDYNASAGNYNMQWLASQGILLTNFHALTHPSEPNYCAAGGGDTFGLDNDDFHQIPGNISTVVDLLDYKNISWAEYQEDMPYPGFQGFNYSNQETYAQDYVRKHNPLVLYNSITANSTRLRQIKNFTAFQSDLTNKQLPQWAFITPNITNGAQDTNINFGARWERSFISALLNNSYFMDNTLVLLTFDEDKSYAKGNRVFSILVGGAIPSNLKGSRDDTFYTHYSSIATVSANWGLPSLGRWDCGANIFEIVANKTGYVNYKVDLTNLLLNETNPGPLSTGVSSKFSPVWPVPVTNVMCSAGQGVLDSIKSAFGNMTATFNYTSPYPYDDSTGYNEYVTATAKSNSTSTDPSAGSASSSATPSPTTAHSAGSAAAVPSSVGAFGAFIALLIYLF